MCDLDWGNIMTGCVDDMAAFEVWWVVVTAVVLSFSLRACGSTSSELLSAISGLDGPAVAVAENSS